MAARPKKTPNATTRKAMEEARQKALPESLIPKRRTDIDEFTLPYEKLAIHLGWEIQQLDGCMIDAAAACYVVLSGICAQQGLPVALIFHDLHDMAQKGELKGYMEAHGKSCPHNPSNR